MRLKSAAVVLLFAVGGMSTVAAVPGLVGTSHAKPNTCRQQANKPSYSVNLTCVASGNNINLEIKNTDVELTAVELTTVGDIVEANCTVLSCDKVVIAALVGQALGKTVVAL